MRPSPSPSSSLTDVHQEESLLSRVELFSCTKQYLYLLSLLILVFLISLFLHYQNYKEFTKFDDFITTALVEKQYKKKNYTVLKLQAENFSFYTSSKEKLKSLEGSKIRVRVFDTQKIGFLDYLKGFYATTALLSNLYEKKPRYRLMQELSTVHKEPSASLFKALFFAGSIPKGTRDKLSGLGVNHLLAISGFHLAVLSFILFFIIKLFYKPLVGRFFPYRNSHKDIAMVVFLLLFAYLYFLNFVPSLLRAFAMSVFAYFLYDRGLKIVSFSSLFLVVSFLLALWPKLLFALGFWFSVMGVLQIFLFLHYMKNLKVWQSFILLHFWVYLAMLPLVHYFFGVFSVEQLFSPLLTMLFILFYPLELFLHVIGEGASLDFVLEYLLSLKLNSIELFTNIWVLLTYLILMILAIFKKFFFYALFIFNLGFFGYLLNGIA